MNDWIVEARENLSNQEGVEEIYFDKFSVLVNSEGKFVSRGSYSSPAMPIFLESLVLQAGRDSASLKVETRAMAERLDCSPIDLKRVKEYQTSDERGKMRVNLSKRARNFVREVDLLYKKFEKKLNFLLLLSPHTFCQIENELAEPVVIGAVNQLTSLDHYGAPSGGWRRCRPYTLHGCGDFRMEVMGYLNVERPRFKLKIFAKNRLYGLEDKLDLEGLFQENGFKGVVHYHVEKSATFGALIKEGIIWPEATNIDHIEISRNPDSKAIIADLGEGKKRTYSDVLGDNFVAGTFDFWRDNPEVLGGPALSQLLRAVEGDSRIRDIQLRSLA
ncbi:MAG: hypothetical protein AABW79_01890 [Nanoarchaeota archaeon]